jgi:outer membrane protein assembly factor BamB
MYEFGAADPFSLRGALSFFDSSPLVSAETDQLIYPGESGILYIIKLNTSYDREKGTLSIAPSDTIRWRYSGVRSGGNSFWYGMETSAAIWRNHLIVGENGGMLICLNLNTLTVDWVADTLDDTNGSPVLELEDGHPYVYIAPSFHIGWRSWSTAPVPVMKIDALTGEVVWRRDYTCYSVDGLSGGAEGTIVVGKNGLSGLIFAPLARTPGIGQGIIAALDKQTGEEVWRYQTQSYIWSSPVAVYDSQGKGYIITCTTAGSVCLLDGLTGELLDTFDAGSNIEATPIVFNDMLIVGTRATGIIGLKLK